jgi:hypothetical protein
MEKWNILKRSLGRASKCWSQPTRIDHISPKKWAAGIRKFEKSPLRVFSLVFWTLPLHLGRWNLLHMELGDFIFFQIFPKIRRWQDLHINHWDFCLIKCEFTKNSSRIASIMEFFLYLSSVQGAFEYVPLIPYV